MIKIITFVSSFKHYEEPINEFLKRLNRNVDFMKLKPSKYKEFNKIIVDETKELVKILEKTKGYKILLFIKGIELSTLEFAKLIEEKETKHSNVIFIIGGSYGVNVESLEKYIDFKFSLSKMTFPHAQAIMVLLEQLYRIFMIKKCSGYHH